jgi:hypothetical protein
LFASVLCIVSSKLPQSTLCCKTYICRARIALKHIEWRNLPIHQEHVLTSHAVNTRFCECSTRWHKDREMVLETIGSGTHGAVVVLSSFSNDAISLVALYFRPVSSRTCTHAASLCIPPTVGPLGATNAKST